jgi:hypothetical protein
MEDMGSGKYISFNEFLRRAEEELGAPEERIAERKEVKKNFTNFFNRMANL